APFDGPYDKSPYDNSAYDNHPQDDEADYGEPPAYLQIPDEAEAQPPKKPEAAQVPPPEPTPQRAPVNLPKISLDQASPENWLQIYLGLNLGGILQSTASNCQLVGRQGSRLHFVLDERNSTLYDESHQQRLADVLSDYFIERVQVVIQPGAVTAETPAATAIRLRAERQASAEEAIRRDPVVLALMEHFGATVREGSVAPL